MNKEDFLPIERTPQEEITSFIKRPSKWARFKVNRLAVLGATIIMVMIVLCNNVLCDILSDIQLFSQQHYTREMSDCYEQTAGNYR